MESKIKEPEYFISSSIAPLLGFDSKQLEVIHESIRLAQRQAIEATLKEAKKQVSGWPAKIKTESEIEDDIDALINSPELKVI